MLGLLKCVVSKFCVGLIFWCWVYYDALRLCFGFGLSVCVVFIKLCCVKVFALGLYFCVGFIKLCCVDVFALGLFICVVLIILCCVCHVSAIVQNAPVQLVILNQRLNLLLTRI